MVGSLQTLAAEGVTQPDPSGMQPLQQLAAIRRRADEDFAPVAVMFGLMALGAVDPGVDAPIDVHGPELADLAWPAAGEAVEADHTGHHFGQVAKFRSQHIWK